MSTKFYEHLLPRGSFTTTLLPYALTPYFLLYPMHVCSCDTNLPSKCRRRWMLGY